MLAHMRHGWDIAVSEVWSDGGAYTAERGGAGLDPSDTLLACVRRASRLGWGGTGPNGAGRWRAVVVAPAGSAHRRQVASALLAREAEEAGGRVFAMAGGDQVLLCPGPADTLRASLLALYPEGAAPVRWLVLPEGAPDLLAYARQEAEIPAAPPPLAAGLRRHTAVLATGGSLVPLFQSVSPAPDNTRLGAADLLDVLPRLLAWTRLSAAPALHVACSLHAVLSPAFASFVDAAEEAGLSARLGVAVPLLDAVADIAAWADAAAIVRAHHATLVIDSVAHASLSLVDPAALGPDLVKLQWSAEMIEGGPGLQAALAAIGPERLVMERADTEVSLRWGLSHGIRRFQGRQVDVMLAGMRMSDCLRGAACSVRQCADRAAATSPQGRAGCLNPAHLSPDLSSGVADAMS